MTLSCRDRSRRVALEESRAAWEQTLRDSLRLYEMRLTATEKELPVMRENFGRQLSEFSLVENAREVEPYYIHTPAKTSYPLKSTGITARLNRSEAPEVIACLKGGNFTSIVISTSAGTSVSSEAVPYDQALNYRAGGLNTVAFIGAQADTLLSFVEAHQNEPLTVTFMNPQKTGHVIVSEAQLRTLRATASLNAARKRLRQAEAEVPALSRKIQRIKERLSDTGDAGSDTTDNSTSNS